MELAAWIEAQHRHSEAGLRAVISRVDLVKERPGFGQRIQAVPGAIVASPVLASYDPDPDYFFHWYRDSALVMEALRVLYEEGRVEGQALTHLRDFVRFSAGLDRLDGRLLQGRWREAVAPHMARYVREEGDLAQVHGDRVRGETRVNPDGTLDITRWGRPQHDGPALRALTLLRFRPQVTDATLKAELESLLAADLDYVCRHAREPCFDIWEEEVGLHYYNLCVSAQALLEGAAGAQGSQAQEWRALGEHLLARLDDYWLEGEGHYRSRILPEGRRSMKELDVSVLLAILHTGRMQGPHSAADPRVQGTLEKLARLFDAEYPINVGRGTGRGPALGRYPGDVYYSGGAYYFATLAGAEICYRAARALAAPELTVQGDAYLATVRAFTPESGALSEQFDRSHGMQTSARQLGWSHAAFITCARARARAPAPL